MISLILGFGLMTMMMQIITGTTMMTLLRVGVDIDNNSDDDDDNLDDDDGDDDDDDNEDEPLRGEVQMTAPPVTD